MLLYILSWLGVACLTAAHVMFAMGAPKRAASLVSACGAAIAFCAAAGLGIWAVAFLNAVWIGISLHGATVFEIYTRSKRRDLIALSTGPVVALAWLAGPDAVTWAVSLSYLAAWWLFSTGQASRREYLIACIMAAAVLVPALLTMQGEAFAANEYLGMIIGLLGVWRCSRSEPALYPAFALITQD